jgi:phosphate-selective porin OprO and OprP
MIGSSDHRPSLLHLLKCGIIPVWLLVSQPPLQVNAGESKIVSSTPVISPKIEVPDTLGERWDNLGRLYQSDSNSVLQELWILGRYHGHYHWSEGSAGNEEGHEIRRFRLGGQARLFEKLTLHAQLVSGSDLEPFYNGFTELWAQWAFSPKVALTLGQQKHRFTHDRNASSRYINYLERSMMTNMFGADYTPAITLLGRLDNVNYYTGFFSNATGGDMGESFTQLNSGYSFLAAVYYDLGKTLGTGTAHLHFTYLHSEAKENATNLNHFNNGLSSALIVTQNSASLVTEVTAGLGSEDGDALALNFQPSFFLTGNLQIAGRYQIATSNGKEGLIAQRRYEQAAGLPSGDFYQAAYLGLNYHIAKHRLKLMTGLEYATMGGEHVWTASTMIRFFFGPHSGGAFPMNQMCDGRYFEYD